MRRLVWGVVLAGALLVGCGQRPGIHLTAEAAPDATSVPSVVAATPTEMPTPDPVPIPSTPAPTAASAATSENAPAPVAQPATEGPTETRRSAAAAGDEEPTERSAPPGDPGEQLWERSFAATRVTEGGRDRPIVDGTSLRLQPFRANGESVLRYSGDCNTGGSPLTITEGRFVVGNRGESSAAGCPDDQTAQGDWYRDFLMSDPAWELTPDAKRLTLTRGDTVIKFERRPWPPYTED